MYKYIGLMKNLSADVLHFARSKEALDVPIYRGGETLRGFLERMEDRLGIEPKVHEELYEDTFRAYVIQLEYLEVALMDLEAI